MTHNTTEPTSEETEREREAAHDLLIELGFKVSDECDIETDEHGDGCLTVAEFRARARREERRITVAHIFDRCWQYEMGSGIVTALENIAVQIADGQAAEAHRHGEFEPELLARVDAITARARKRKESGK